MRFVTSEQISRPAGRFLATMAVVISTIEKFKEQFYELEMWRLGPHLPLA
jgi:hypothetical protein